MPLVLGFEWLQGRFIGGIGCYLGTVGRTVVCWGGFNMICFPFERKRGARTSFSMRRFFDVNEELGLRDIPLQGGPFTWKGGRNNGSMSKLDRFLLFW